MHYGRREKSSGRRNERKYSHRRKKTQKTKEAKKTDKKASKKQKADDLIKEKDQQIGELTDKYQRLMAEFENVRKRTAKEFVQRYDMGAMGVLEKLLPVVDNFEGTSGRGRGRKRFSICSGHRTDL